MGALIGDVSGGGPSSWGALLWPITANNANPYPSFGFQNREYPLTGSTHPWYFTATDGSLFMSDTYLLFAYPTTRISDGSGSSFGYFFMGQYSLYNTITVETFAQLLGQTVTTTDTADFTITSDAYSNLGTGQDITGLIPSIDTYVLTVGYLTEVL